MPQEPRVRVGILSAPTISFTLTGLYSTLSGEMVTGRQEVSLSESGLAVS